VEFGSARFSERSEVLDLLALWYDDRSFFARYNENDRAFRDELCLVARDNGRIVTTVQIFDRRIRLMGQEMAMGGIGSVYTLKEFRKRGIASELMRLSLRTMEREAFELSLLFAERLKFYSGFGWESVQRQFTAISSADSIRTESTVELDDFQPQRDLKEVSRIHESYSGRFDGTVVRDRDYWVGNLAFAGNPSEIFVIARVHGRIEGYGRAVTFHQIPMLMEYGYLPGCENSALAIFRHFGAMVRDQPSLFAFDPEHRHDAQKPSNAAILLSHTVHDSALEAQLKGAGAHLYHHPDNYYMWRVINGRKMAERLGCTEAEAGKRMMDAVKATDSLYWTADRF
jgi:GNAT superfamily N-acetyltransferase